MSEDRRRCHVTLFVMTQAVPVASDADGVVRIAGTRVTLDTVVAAFCDGMTAEGIVDQYPSLSLADVYLVIGYFLSHRDEVNAYLAARQQQATAARSANEARFDPAGVRDRLLARRHPG